MELQKRKNNWIKIVLMLLAFIIVASLAVVFGLFHVRHVDVIGNEFYSAEEIQNMVMSDSMGENSLYLLWKYSQPEAADSIPFLSGVEVEMVNPYHIQLRVYEKAIVGYLMYSGSMVYFDKDGIVVEISQEQREGLPPYSGISIGQPVVGEPLPVANEDFFRVIVEEAQQLSQSKLDLREVHYDENRELMLYFEHNRVLLGSSSYMEEKLSNLSALLPEMEDLDGTLHMEDYTAGTTTITFKKGEKGEEELIMNLKGSSNSEVGLSGSEGEEETETEGDQEIKPGSSGYVEDKSRITKDADGNEMYTDAFGNVTYDMSKPYLGDDGQVITDGYGYIDPYTGAYILN